MCHFDVDNSSLLCDIDTLMWLSSTLMLPFNFFLNRTMCMYRIYHVYEEYKRRYTPLDGLPEAIAEGKQPSGVYRVYTPSRRGISSLYNI